MLATEKRIRLAVVLSHPTQYFSPWFRYIAANTNIEIKLFYLWDFGVESRHDRNFGHTLKWDIPLLEGYAYEFISNASRDPGTHHFFGLNNPGLVSSLAQWKPDTVLLFGYNYASHLIVLLSWSLRKIPMLQRGDSHDLARKAGWKPKLNRFLRSLIFKRFAAFLSVGKANADYLRNSGVAEKRIHFVPHCVDNLRFQSSIVPATKDAAEWRQELGIPESAIVFLFAGKFENKKRPQDLIQAFLAMLSKEASFEPPQTVLVLVGAGKLEAQLRLLAGEQLGQTIFFVPFQNQTQMPKVYALANILVLPSLGDGETWGLAVNEAMNMGVPAIVSSHVGCGPDIVKNSMTGWVFEAGNFDALCSAMIQMLALGKDGLAMKGASAKALMQKYSYEAATAGLVKSLEDILAK